MLGLYHGLMTGFDPRHAQRMERQGISGRDLRGVGYDLVGVRHLRIARCAPRCVLESTLAIRTTGLRVALVAAVLGTGVGTGIVHCSCTSAEFLLPGSCSQFKLPRIG